jgi:phosphatidylglycerophosphate synthase
VVAQVALLAGLTATVGLGPTGWAAGLAYGIVVSFALARGLDRAGADRLGPANAVTLARAVLVGGVTALTAQSFTDPGTVGPLVGLTVVALALDGVDGQVARRTGSVSALGARFDMESDAFLLLVLSVHLVGPVGPWVIAIGAMRYAFVAAMPVLPWLRATLPPRYWRKVVAATEGVTLVVATAAVLPGPVAAVALAVALALLVESFGRDVRWLWRRRPVPARQPVSARRPVPARQPAAARRPAPARRPVPVNRSVPTIWVVPTARRQALGAALFRVAVKETRT